MLIVARAIQGCGGGGLIVLVNICIGDLFSLRYASSLRFLYNISLPVASALEIPFSKTSSLNYTYAPVLSIISHLAHISLDHEERTTE